MATHVIAAAKLQNYIAEAEAALNRLDPDDAPEPVEIDSVALRWVTRLAQIHLTNLVNDGFGSVAWTK